MCGKSDEPRIEPTVMVNLANELRILFEETMSSHRNNFVSLSREIICRRKNAYDRNSRWKMFFSNNFGSKLSMAIHQHFQCIETVTKLLALNLLFSDLAVLFERFRIKPSVRLTQIRLVPSLCFYFLPTGTPLYLQSGLIKIYSDCWIEFI